MPEHDSIAKICWSNVRLAFEMLNATPKYIFSHRWGYKQNGVWSGMIDDLYSDRADVGKTELLYPNHKITREIFFVFCHKNIATRKGRTERRTHTYFCFVFYVHRNKLPGPARTFASRSLHRRLSTIPRPVHIPSASSLLRV